MDKKDHLIIVGTVFLAPLLWKIQSLVRKNKVKTVLWIRSKTVGEMKARNSKYVFLAKLFELIMIKKSKIIIANGEDTLSYYQTLYTKYQKKMFTVFNAVNYKQYSQIKINNNHSDKKN